MTRRILSAVLFVLLVASFVFGQANGKLQIHFMDVGQGDGTILISPEGETVLFDNGVAKKCDPCLSYLQQLEVTRINYHVASHYHADHIGCTSEVLDMFPLVVAAFDRGSGCDAIGEGIE
jgi:competence protein ComEC